MLIESQIDLVQSRQRWYTVFYDAYEFGFDLMLLVKKKDCSYASCSEQYVTGNKTNDMAGKESLMKPVLFMNHCQSGKMNLADRG